jgi:hypothetical protein
MNPTLTALESRVATLEKTVATLTATPDPQPPGLLPLTRRCIHLACAYYGISTADIFTRRKTRPLADARMLSVYLFRQLHSYRRTAADQFRLDYGSIVHAEREAASKRLGQTI